MKTAPGRYCPPRPPFRPHHTRKPGLRLRERECILFLKKLRPLGNQSPGGRSREDAGKGVNQGARRTCKSAARRGASCRKGSGASCMGPACVPGCKGGSRRPGWGRRPGASPDLEPEPGGGGGHRRDSHPKEGKGGAQTRSRWLLPLRRQFGVPWRDPLSLGEACAGLWCRHGAASPTGWMTSPSAGSRTLSWGRVFMRTWSQGPARAPLSWEWGTFVTDSHPPEKNDASAAGGGHSTLPRGGGRGRPQPGWGRPSWTENK